MNNACTLFALRALQPASCRPAPRPLLHLFNDHAKRWSSRSMTTTDPQHPRRVAYREAIDLSRRTFSSTACLEKKAGSSKAHKKSVARPAQDSRRPAQSGQSQPLKSQPRSAPSQHANSGSTAAVAPNVLPPHHANSGSTAAVPPKVLPPSEEETPTWRDYDPAGGMPLPDGERDVRQLKAIFSGKGIDPATGNYILSVVYWRRQSGALIDYGLHFPEDSGVSGDMAMEGLEYLRKLDPDFDEEAAGALWATEESERVKDELVQQGVDQGVALRLVKRVPAEGEEQEQEQEEEEPHPVDAHRPRTSDSVVEAMIRRGEVLRAQEEATAALKAEQAERAALASRRGPLELAGGVQPSTELILYGPHGLRTNPPSNKAWRLPVQRKPWVKYYEERAKITKDSTAPQLSLSRRLLPSFLTLIAVVGFCLFLGDNYVSPPRSARRWPDTPPAIATMAVITAILATCFVASRMPWLWRFSNKFFLICPGFPYAASMIGATFRHDNLAHLASNLGLLWLVGLVLHEDVGRGNFLAVFLSAATAGAFTSLAHSVLRKNWHTYTCGASGAALGILAATCVLRPHARITVAGQEIPVEAWTWLAVCAASVVMAQLAVKNPRFPMLARIDHMTHMGGLTAGVAAGTLLRARTRPEVTGGEPVLAEARKAGGTSR